MPRIKKTDDNVVEIPSNVSVGTGGYVYLNTRTWWGEAKGGGKKCAQHDKVCVGLAVAGKDGWRQDRRMWANANWWAMFPKPSEEEAPATSDCVRVGLTASLSALADECGIAGCLEEALGGPATADAVIDFACHVVSEESAVAQHYPHWARDHATRSGVLSDSYISDLLSRGIEPSQIEEFKKLWARTAIGDGRACLCYDSTNADSQADGVFLVQKGHAKDDPDPGQADTDYAVRQSDGLPVTFSEYPGSINDVMQAQEVYDFLGGLVGEGAIKDVCMVYDRGYVSEDNVRELHDSGIGFLMIPRRNMKITDEVITAALGEGLGEARTYLTDKCCHAVTLRRELFEGIGAWFHVVLDPKLQRSQQHELLTRVEREEARLARDAARGTRHTEEELERLRARFTVEAHEDGTLEVNMRGRGAGKKKQARAYVIDSFERDWEKIEEESRRCGVYVIATDRAPTAREAMEAYDKRDAVEKTFRALKSYLGMDKYGVHSDAAMHSKALVWFVASVLRTLLFTRTKPLREKERKRFTTPATIRLLDEIEAFRDLGTGEYRRRYQPTRAQKDVLRHIGVKVTQLDEAVAELARA